MEMVLERILVCGGLVRPDTLQDLDDDIGVALCVEVDFLMVGDFSDGAVCRLVNGPWD